MPKEAGKLQIIQAIFDLRIFAIKKAWITNLWWIKKIKKWALEKKSPIKKRGETIKGTLNISKIAANEIKHYDDYT